MKGHVNYTANSKEKMDGLNWMRLKRIAIKVFENCLKEKTDGLNWTRLKRIAIYIKVFEKCSACQFSKYITLYVFFVT